MHLPFEHVQFKAYSSYMLYFQKKKKEEKKDYKDQLGDF